MSISLAALGVIILAWNAWQIGIGRVILIAIAGTLVAVVGTIAAFGIQIVGAITQIANGLGGVG